MGLSGQQRKELQDALIDAFPEKLLLEQMLSFELDKNLDEIASGANLREVVFNLIKIAEAENRIQKLISAACKSNPGNESLKAIAEKINSTESNTLIRKEQVEISETYTSTQKQKQHQENLAQYGKQQEKERISSQKEVESRQKQAITVRFKPQTEPQRIKKETKIQVSLKQLFLPVLFRSCAVTILLVVLRFVGIFQQMELKTFDSFMRWRPDEGPDERLLVIAITEKDIKAQDRRERGEFSISDHKLNQLLAKLENYQPRIIGLDLYRNKTDLEELKTRLRRSNIFGVCKVFSSNTPDSDKTDKTKSPSPPEIPKQRKGFSDVLPDKDKIVRRHLLQMKPANPDPDCSRQYAFSLQLASYYAKSYLQKKLRWSSNNYLTIDNIVFQPIEAFTGGYQGVDAGGHQVLLNYRTHQNSPQKAIMQITLGDVLDQNGLDAVENLSQRIVLIGVTSKTRDTFFIPDIFPTPYEEEIPGVVLQAQMISQIISAVENQRPLLWVWPQWGEWLWIGAWSFFGSILASRFRGFSSLALAEGVAFVGLGGTCFVFLLYGGWIPFVLPALALVITGTPVFVYIKFQSFIKVN